MAGRHDKNIPDYPGINSTWKVAPRKIPVSEAIPRPDINYNSTDWIRLEEYFRLQKQALRKANDDLTLTPLETAGIRAKIELLKEIIKLKDPVPEIPSYGSDESEIF